MPVRTVSGSTTAVVRFATTAADSEFVGELLLQRTLSLYQEGHRWIAYRRLNRQRDRESRTLFYMPLEKIALYPGAAILFVRFERVGESPPLAQQCQQ